MFSRVELIILVGVIPILILITKEIISRVRGKRLPTGSIILEDSIPEDANMKPGTMWTQVGTTIVFMGNIFLSFFAAIANIFDFWHLLPQLLFIHLPLWLNWIGVIVGLTMDIIGLVVQYYNVNYTVVFYNLKGKYVLATGGPYKRIRHPIYIATCILTIAIFLITEFWPLLLTILCWGALRKQAMYEETSLRSLFKEKYDTYYQATGRFFPRCGHKSKKND